ncbi:MAG: pilus assembly protein [Eggerthellaceae bacterium]|nr:pilus assembly protein [Eggerthellaceae bacterium]MBQ9044280.1 pilus assembly protein [Eggerthellaceae bacterium]
MRGIRDNCGQGTVEAAVVIPVMFLLLLMLVQPGIVLYDRLVMGNAAAEGCRLLATATSDMGGSCEAFVRHRLAAVPQHDCFHVHGGDCSWDIELTGDESAETVTVRIGNEIRPLPLFDAGAKLLGMTNAAGNLEIEESVTLPTQPGWVASSELGMAPSSWIGAWSS